MWKRVPDCMSCSSSCCLATGDDETLKDVNTNTNRDLAMKDEDKAEKDILSKKSFIYSQVTQINSAPPPILGKVDSITSTCDGVKEIDQKFPFDTIERRM